jgi:roadblock/LC7 domain-containing protein
MTGTDGGAGPGARPGWRWDVALSFAGAQRHYVEQVAEALKAGGVRCFYDADEQIDLWGKYLAEELPVIYGEQAAVVVVFVSAEYASRDWTRLERRVALGRAVQERREYVLPARFDDTPLPGLLSDMVTMDVRGRSPEQFAAMIADKLAELGVIVSMSPTGLQATVPAPPRWAAPAPVPPSHLARTLIGHFDRVSGVAYSPDGGLLATSSDDNTARVWDPVTGKRLRKLTGHILTGQLGAVAGVAFSPDGRLLATAGGDRTARVWDPATGKHLRKLVGHTGTVHGVAFSRDGRLLATAGGDDTARVWDPATGEHVHTLTGHPGGVLAVAFSPDGLLLATSGYGRVRLWDQTTGKHLRILTVDGDWLFGASFSPDGRLLAIADGDGTARIWDPATGEHLRTLTGHTGGLLGVAFSPDGLLLATAGSDKTARIWD